MENLKRRKVTTRKFRASRHHTTHGHVTESSEKQRRRYLLRKAAKQHEQQERDAIEKLKFHRRQKDRSPSSISSNVVSPTRSIGGESIDSELGDIESIVSQLVTGSQEKKKKKKKKKKTRPNATTTQRRRPVYTQRNKKRQVDTFSKPAWRPGGSLSTHSKGCHKSVEQVILRQGNVSKFGSISHERLALTASQAFGDDPTVMSDPSSPLARLVEEGLSVSEHGSDLLMLEDGSSSREKKSVQDVNLSLLEDREEERRNDDLNARDMEDLLIRLRKETKSANQTRADIEREILEARRELNDVRAETDELQIRAQQVMSQFKQTFGENVRTDEIFNGMFNVESAVDSAAMSIPDASPPPKSEFSVGFSDNTTTTTTTTKHSSKTNRRPPPPPSFSSYYFPSKKNRAYDDDEFDDLEERQMDSVIEGVIDDVNDFL